VPRRSVGRAIVGLTVTIAVNSTTACRMERCGTPSFPSMLVLTFAGAYACAGSSAAFSATFCARCAGISS
jgi:hypothetical protein